MKKFKYKSSFEGEFIKFYEAWFYTPTENAGGVKKDIKEAITYIDKVLHISGKRILDVGCGTGIFEPLLMDCGADSVRAVDISSDMVNFAKKHHYGQGISYEVADFCENTVEDKFDIVIAMSYVVGYQLSNEKLISFFRNVSKSLKRDGLFAFNFYHLPGIYQATLAPRCRRAVIENTEIICISDVKIQGMTNTLDEHYIYLSEEEKGLIHIEIDESMRFFTLREMEEYLLLSGLRIRNLYRYNTLENLVPDEWNGFIVAQKI